MTTTSALPLTGIRVIDLATARGEVAGRVLAELGAEVIKIEPPGGAEARRLPPFIRGRETDPDGSLFWASVALGKRSVVLDIQQPADRERLQRLLGGADILVESFDPGALAPLGLDYATLQARYPALIYVSITPYGQTGPDAHSPASDITLQAAGGLVAMQGDWDRRPIPVGEPYTAAFHGGAQGAADAIIALQERDRSGLGQHLDVSMQAAIVWTLMNATGYPPNEHRDPPGYGEDRGDSPVSLTAMALVSRGITDVDMPSLWECADGYFAGMLTPTEQRADVFVAFLRWADESGALGPDRNLFDINWATYLPDVQAGHQTTDPLKRAVARLRAFFLTRTKQQIMDRSLSDSLFIAPVYNTRDLAADPHLAGRDFWPKVGAITHPGAFAKFSRTPVELSRGAPALDEGRALLDAPARAPSAPAAPRVRPPAPRQRPFEGLKVADFAWIGVGPIVAKAIADHGATTVHVESAQRIDGLRLGAPFKNGVIDPNGSQFFANFNSSKYGLALHLGTPEGLQIARQLIDWADVVVESFTPGTMKKMGLDYATISQKRPDLIMFSTCLRGQTGPQAPLAGYGNSGATLSGLHALTGWPDRAPAGPWAAYTDFVTPRYGVAALAAAILHRQRTGLGQHVDVSQVECGIRFLEPEMLDYTVNGVVAPPPWDKTPLACPNGTYQVRGKERYIALGVETTAQWRALRSLAPLDAFTDAALDALPARKAAEEAIDGALRGWLRDQDAWEIAARLKAAGVPAAVVERPSDLYHDRQLAHREFFVSLNHTQMGPTPYDGFVTRFSDMPSAPRFAAPCLGEHTDYVLREILGLAPGEIAARQTAGVLV